MASIGDSYIYNHASLRISLFRVFFSSPSASSTPTFLGRQFIYSRHNEAYLHDLKPCPFGGYRLDVVVDDTLWLVGPHPIEQILLVECRH
jgi:hypothetical protein